MIRGATAAASDSTAAEAAQATLDGAGSAADALVAGFLAAAGAHPGVLFAPAVALVAGVGVGARVFDGRAAQPGRGAQRPRGFLEGDLVPDAARVAAPRVLPMLILLHNYFGRARLRELARPAAATAAQTGASSRAALLRQVGESGVLSLRGREVERALLAAGGPVAGGLLTSEDIAEALPVEADAQVTDHSTGAVLRAPWPVGAEARCAETIVACDNRGAIAALAYAPAREGIEVPELEVTLGRDAVPVRRGIPRVAPGTLLPTAAPIAIVQRIGGFAAAVGLPGEPSIDAEALVEIAAGPSIQAMLADVCARAAARTAVAVVRDARGARALIVSTRAAEDIGPGACPVPPSLDAAQAKGAAEPSGHTD